MPTEDAKPEKQDAKPEQQVETLFTRLGLKPVYKVGLWVVFILDGIKRVTELPETFHKDVTFLRAVGHLAWQFLLFPLKFFLLAALAGLTLAGAVGVVFMIGNIVSRGGLAEFAKQYEERLGQITAVVGMLIAGWMYYKYGFGGSIKLFL